MIKEIEKEKLINEEKEKLIEKEKIINEEIERKLLEDKIIEEELIKKYDKQLSDKTIELSKKFLDIEIKQQKIFKDISDNISKNKNASELLHKRLISINKTLEQQRDYLEIEKNDLASEVIQNETNTRLFLENKRESEELIKSDQEKIKKEKEEINSLKKQNEIKQQQLNYDINQIETEKQQFAQNRFDLDAELVELHNAQNQLAFEKANLSQQIENEKEGIRNAQEQLAINNSLYNQNRSKLDSEIVFLRDAQDQLETNRKLLQLNQLDFDTLKKNEEEILTNKEYRLNEREKKLSEIKDINEAKQGLLNMREEVIPPHVEQQSKRHRKEIVEIKNNDDTDDTVNNDDGDASYDPNDPYEEKKKKKKREYKKKKEKKYDDNILNDDTRTNYPFKSKLKFISNYFPPEDYLDDDKKLKNLKKYYRPYFSPKFHSWEIDFLITGQLRLPAGATFYSNILIFININTKYLVIYPETINVPKTAVFVINCFDDMLGKRKIKINNVRGDMDVVFSEEVQDYLQKKNISYYFTSNKLINS
jgi:hypothetical protein